VNLEYVEREWLKNAKLDNNNRVCIVKDREYSFRLQMFAAFDFLHQLWLFILLKIKYNMIYYIK
jgi:hypothetical protein